MTEGYRWNKNDSWTERQKEVIRLIALPTDEIAQRLSIKKSTVEAHLGTAMQIVGVKSRVALLVWALKNDIVKVSDLE